MLEDGSLGNYELLHDFGNHRGIDGMVLDAEGNIMATKKMTSDQRFWRKWNLDYTKRVIETNSAGQMAKSLMSCWSPRIQGTLRARYDIWGNRDER